MTPAQQVDLNEAGRVLAQLDDWRAIVFVFMFMFIVMVLERGLSAIQMRRERQQMWQLAQTMTSNSEKVAEALNGLKVEFQAARMVASRMEAVSESWKNAG